MLSQPAFCVALIGTEHSLSEEEQRQSPLLAGLGVCVEEVLVLSVLLSDRTG